MANPIWDGIVTYVSFAAATTSSSFNIPAGSGAITIIMPDLTTSTEVAIHGLSPLDRTTWTAVSAYDPSAGTQEPVVALESSYVVIPASALGCGTFRLVAADAQTFAAIPIIIDRI